MPRVLILLTSMTLLAPAFVGAQTTVSVWFYDQWQTMELSERFLMITPSASPTPILEAAGFPGFEYIGETTDCMEFSYGIFERPYASGTPMPFSTMDVVEALGVGTGQGYFWSPVLTWPGEPEAAFSPSPFRRIRFTPDTADLEARAIIATAGLGTVYRHYPESHVYFAISTVPSGRVVYEGVGSLVDHPQVLSVFAEWMALFPTGCPSGGGGGGGSPWPPTGGAPAEIPTLSTLALAALTLLLVLGSLTTLRRRWSTTAPRAHQGQARLR